MPVQFEDDDMVQICFNDAIAVTQPDWRSCPKKRRPALTKCHQHSTISFLQGRGPSPVHASAGLIMLLLLLLTSASCNFISDPVCPSASPRPPSQCRGQLSNCWSPGVRDTGNHSRAGANAWYVMGGNRGVILWFSDCPGHGLCCYDGCANTFCPNPSHNAMAC